MYARLSRQKGISQRDRHRSILHVLYFIKIMIYILQNRKYDYKLEKRVPKLGKYLGKQMFVAYFNVNNMKTHQ